jgi:hypothetical protein
MVRAMGPPMVVNLGFLDRSHYFAFKYLLKYPHEAEWIPFQTHYFIENLVPPGQIISWLTCGITKFPLILEEALQGTRSVQR